MRGERDIDVKFDDWQKLIHELENTYTISLTEVCEIMKASRSWVNKYIRPYVRSVYIRNNRRGDAKIGIDWLRIAAEQLGREEMKDSIWFHRADFEGYINNRIISVTSQTKSIPLILCIEPRKRAEFHARRSQKRKELKEARGASKIEKYLELNNLVNEFASKDGAALMRAEANQTRRSDYPPIPVDLPEEHMKSWKAPHELKGYGGVDETIYRELFRSGSIRIELAFADIDGVVGKKVYYIPDPDPVETEYEEEGYITIPRDIWNQYRSRLT